MNFLKLFNRGLKGNVCISYPKSGRTWVKFALTVANAPVHYNHGGYASRDPKQLGYKFKGLRKAYFGERNIYLHRNPIYTAVSEFHQIHNRIFNPSHPKYEQIKQRLIEINLVPPSEIDEFVLHPIWGCAKVSEFNRAHIKYFSKKPNAKLVSYEDLKANPADKFAELLDFVGVHDYDIERIVVESSFDNMRKIELSADADIKKKHSLYGMKNNNENSRKVRKGKVMGYLDALSPGTVEKARKICAKHGFSA